MPLAALILTAVTLQRLGELVLANRNTARLLALGGVEKSPGHYPLIVLMHAAWLALLWVLAAGASIDGVATKAHGACIGSDAAGAMQPVHRRR